MEKNRIIKFILLHLNERGYREVAQKLESESEVLSDGKEIKEAIDLLKEEKIEDTMKVLQQGAENCVKTNHIENYITILLIYNKIALFTVFNALLDKEVEKAITLTRFYTSEFSSILKIPGIPDEIFINEISLFKKCSQLFFIQDEIKLKEKMKEISKESMSIENLITFIDSFHISDGYLIKNQSLVDILKSVIKNQIKYCEFHNTNQNNFSYFNDHNCKLAMIPYRFINSIEYHNEEILNIVFSNHQEYFAAILKDNNIAIYKLIRHTKICDVSNYSDMYVQSIQPNQILNLNKKTEIEIRFVNIINNPHKNQITSLQWNMNDTLILTASKDKTIKIFEAFSGICKYAIDNHDAMVSSAIYVMYDSKIISSGLDYKISFFSGSDLHLEHSIHIPNVTVSELLYSVALNFVIAVSATTNSILLYDIATKTEVEKIPINDVIISCAISKLDGGKFLLVNSSKATPVLNLYNLEICKNERKYFGHRQERFINKCNFGGEGENFLTCGSDDAKVYVWNRHHSIPVYSIKLHSSAVNAVIWSNSLFTDMILSCSDDHTIKILVNDQVDKIHISYSRENSNLKSLEYKMTNLEEKGSKNKNIVNITNSKLHLILNYIKFLTLI